MPTAGIKLLVAIDIGTACTGYAYKFVDEPDVEHTSCFNGKQKTTSSILLNENDKFMAYGLEAEEQFIECHAKGDNSVKLFNSFKMTFHNNPKLSKASTVCDVSGKHSVPVFDLFVMSLRYVKNHVMRWINRSSMTYSEDDVSFIILVPAIFDDRAKWFVREAALKSGVKPSQLTLAPEAEMSSLWCQHENINKIKDKGTKYMVFDIGGGTVDIAAHESCGDVSINSINYVSGGNWAGLQVDNCLRSYLVLLFGSQSIDSLVQNQTAEGFQLLQNYNKAKAGKMRGKCQELSIFIPESVRKGALADKGLHNMSELENLIKAPNFGGHFKLVGDMLTIENEALKGMYTYTVNSLMETMNNLYLKGVGNDCKNITKLIFVGGLINSATLREMIQDMFSNYDTSFVQESEMYALKGSLLYGQKKSLIHTRVVPLTYGIRTTVPYDETKHKDGQTIMLNGQKMCTDNFHVIVKAGKIVKCGQELKEVDKPLRPEDSKQYFEFYSCGQTNEAPPSLVTHYLIQKEASASIPLPFGKLIDDKIFERCFVLGEPELLLKITFKKGKKETIVTALNY